MALIEDQTTFDKTYDAAQRPSVQALLRLAPASVQRSAEAFQLAKSGTVIDYAIDVNGMDPFKVMTARKSAGLTWVPSALQQPLGQVPGIAFPGIAPEPGQTVYDPSSPPAGSIKVSLDSDDYPPYGGDAPTTPPAVITSPVGINEGGGIYSATTLARTMFDAGELVDGQPTFGDPRGTFVFHADPDFFAPENTTLFFTAT